MASSQPVTLVISEMLDKTDAGALRLAGVETTTWPDVGNARVSEHEVVIIDTRIEAKRGDPDPYRGTFMGMRSEVEILLRAGGVVFVLTGPSMAVQYEGRLTVTETNYDFLPDLFLAATGLADSESRIGKRFIVTEKRWSEYFQSVSMYFKTIGGIEKREKGWVLSYTNPNDSRLDYSTPAHPLALSKAASQVISSIVQWQAGTIGLLPPPDKSFLALNFLTKIGADIYRRNLEEAGHHVEPPAWIGDYKTAEQTELESKAEKLLEELGKFERRLSHFRVVSSCLYSTGDQLERAVAKIFTDLQWDFDDLTKKREAIDYVVHEKHSTRELLIALTGTGGYIAADNKKIAQLFGALAQVSEHQKLVFLVNPLAEDDPSSRVIQKCVTDEALRRLTKHDICVLFAHDLYRLWKDWIEKRRSAEQIFDIVYRTSGLCQYAPP